MKKQENSGYTHKLVVIKQNSDITTLSNLQINL